MERAKKVKMQTESGAIYTLDREAMTARRVGTVDIRGVPPDEDGANLLTLTAWPDLRIGERAFIEVSDSRGFDYITTTRIVRLELVA